MGEAERLERLFDAAMRDIYDSAARPATWLTIKRDLAASLGPLHAEHLVAGADRPWVPLVTEAEVGDASVHKGGRHAEA